MGTSSRSVIPQKTIKSLFYSILYVFIPLISPPANVRSLLFLSLAVSSLYDPPSLLSLSPSLPSCSSPSFGSLLTDDFIKLSLPSARTHFHCFPYLDSILLIGGSSFLSLPSLPAFRAAASISSMSGSFSPPRPNGCFSAKTPRRRSSRARPARSPATA